MIRYHGHIIRDCISYAKDLSEALSVAPSYFKGTDGKWYQLIERGIGTVPQALANVFERMPVVS